MKNKVNYIETADRKYPICFNLNVLEEIQEQYGSMKAWGEAVQPSDNSEPTIKVLKSGLVAMINEAIDIENEQNGTNDAPVTSKQVGWIISEVGLGVIVEKIKELTASANRVDGGKNE